MKQRMTSKEYLQSLNPKKKKNHQSHTPGKMNQTEEKWSWELEIEKRAGIIDDWLFEPIRLKLADRCTYTPDFMVAVYERGIAFHEIKGGGPIRDDAIVKFKMAREKYWYFDFHMYQLKDGIWTEKYKEK